MIIFDHFSLLVTYVFGNHAVIAEERPLRKIIELFGLVGGGMYRATQMWIADIAQQENRADDTSQLTEGEIQLIFTAVTTQTAHQCGRDDLASFDRYGNAHHVQIMASNQFPIDCWAGK